MQQIQHPATKHTDQLHLGIAILPHKIVRHRTRWQLVSVLRLQEVQVEYIEACDEQDVDTPPQSTTRR
jgi:chorismate mutase